MESKDFNNLLEDMGQEVQNELMRQKEKQFEQAQAYTPEEIKDLIDSSLISSDILIEGYGLAEKLTSIDGISLAALMHMREILENILFWMDYKFPSNENQLITEEKPIIIKKTTKTKFIK